MSAAAWVASVVGGLVVLGAASYATYQLLQPDEGAPDLALHTKFPKGYDRRSIDLAAVAFDGKSRCFGVGALFSAEAREWGHDGIAHTVTEPTAKQVREANPIIHDNYGYVGTSRAPRISNHTQLDGISRVGVCSFEYDATAWATQADVANTKATDILDTSGVPFTYARTNVKLGSNSDGGTRFEIHGESSQADIVIGYQVFETDRLAPASLLDYGSIGPTFEGNGNFSVIFDVKPLVQREATLVLIPSRTMAEETRAVSSDQLRFTTLFRMEPTSATVTLTAPNLPSNGKTYEAATLEQAWGKAEDDGLVENLEAISSTAVIVHTAFEPEAPLGKVRHYQKLHPEILRSGMRVELAEARVAATIDTTYTWTATSRQATLAIQQTGRITTISEAATATAALSQIGADGVAVAKAVAEGPSARMAVESAHRILDGRAQVLELEAHSIARGTDLLAGPQKYFVAAGALAAGWEWSQALQSRDIVVQLGHELLAAKIVAETIFSLTPQGAVLVAATNLAGYLAGKLVPDDIQQLANRAFNAVILGRVPADSARSAFNEAVPQISEFAKANNAGVLDYQIEKTRDVPSLNPIVLLAFLFVVVRKWRKD